jgi:hypothetical protein
MWNPSPDHPLRRLFSGLTEHTFISTFGLADPALTDYLSELLSRFIHIDAVFHVRNTQGKRLEEVAAMMLEAEALPPEGRTRREIHRHIGDFTLFWAGVYPEALRRLQHRDGADQFLNYCAQGKRSYLIASLFDADERCREEAPVLRRLSTEFELCAYGLNQVRKEWEKHPAAGLEG